MQLHKVIVHFVKLVIVSNADTWETYGKGLYEISTNCHISYNDKYLTIHLHFASYCWFSCSCSRSINSLQEVINSSV